MSDNDFFAQFDKKKQEIKQENISEAKLYPAWVEQSNKPDKTRVMYDVVIKLFDETAEKIQTNTFTKASDIRLSQAQVCRETPFLTGRSGLKNHTKIVELMGLKNEELEKLFGEQKNRRRKSTVRKTKSMIKSELEEYKDEYLAKTQVELDRLINSELLISQADAHAEIEKLKVEKSALMKELAEIKYSNEKLQAEIMSLQQRLFNNEKPPTLIKVAEKKGKISK